MAIERNDFGWTVYCDGAGCSSDLDVDSSEHYWSDVTHTIRENGWISRKDDDGHWEHICPFHQEEEE